MKLVVYTDREKAAAFVGSKRDRQIDLPQLGVLVHIRRSGCIHICGQGNCTDECAKAIEWAKNNLGRVPTMGGEYLGLVFKEKQYGCFARVGLPSYDIFTQGLLRREDYDRARPKPVIGDVIKVRIVEIDHAGIKIRLKICK